jgi:putative glutamate/gamma-aminobutyrate antiporter
VWRKSLEKAPEKKRFMNVFLLALLNLSVMSSLRNLPIVSEYGYGSLFFYFLVALVFLFPAALISAELATGWNQTGGVYIWVKEAFGPMWGFFAVWMQWIHNVTWFPAILAFSAATFAYVFDPELANNKVYIISCILIGFWGMTLYNSLGLKFSTWFSAIGVVAGTIIPGFLIIALGVSWIVGGHTVEIEFSLDTLIPKMNDIQNIVFLSGLFLAFGGLEVSAVHAKEVQNPQRNFPRAILIAAVLCFVVYTLGALAIAYVIPQDQISLVGGVMEAFRIFFVNNNVEYLLTPIAIMIVYGAVGELNAWIIGPIRALHATSKHGDLPPIFQKVNRHGMPMNLLIFQGFIVTVASFVFLFMPSASAAFWILSAMSIQIYLVMYVLMFLAAIKLRYSHPHIERPYRIPYHKKGIWFVAGLGVLSSTFAFFVSFVPPGQLPTGNIYFYEGFLIIGIALMSLIPFLIYFFRKKSWHAKG